MKITVFTFKGGQGKTSLAVALALEYEFLVVNNDIYSIIDKVLPKGTAKILEQDEDVPVLPDEVDIIYDFGGYADERVVDALAISDWVIIPVTNKDEQCLHSARKSIREVMEHTHNIVIVATQTKKGDFEEIKSELQAFQQFPLIEIKQTTAFERMMKERKSISSLMKNNPLLKYHYREPYKQIGSIKNYMDKG